MSQETPFPPPTPPEDGGSDKLFKREATPITVSPEIFDIPRESISEGLTTRFESLLEMLPNSGVRNVLRGLADAHPELRVELIERLRAEVLGKKEKQKLTDGFDEDIKFVDESGRRLIAAALLRKLVLQRLKWKGEDKGLALIPGNPSHKIKSIKKELSEYFFNLMKTMKDSVGENLDDLFRREVNDIGDSNKVLSRLNQSHQAGTRIDGRMTDDVFLFKRLINRFFPELKDSDWLKSTVYGFISQEDTTDNKSKVFISYARADLAGYGGVASELKTLIERQRKDETLNIFLDTEGIQSGEDWRTRLLKELQGSDRLELMLTNRSIRSEVVAQEILAARELGIKIVPVRLENITPPDRETESDAWHRYNQIKDIIHGPNWVDMVPPVKKESGIIILRPPEEARLHEQVQRIEDERKERTWRNAVYSKLKDEALALTEEEKIKRFWDV